MSNTTFKLGMEDIQRMQIFESITKTSLRDCIKTSEDELLFVVNSELMGKAVGKNGKNVKLLNKKFKKKIVLLGFNKDYKEFAKNLLMPVKIKSIKEENGILRIVIQTQLRAFSSKKIKKAKMLLKKYFLNIKDVSIKGI